MSLLWKFKQHVSKNELQDYNFALSLPIFWVILISVTKRLNLEQREQQSHMKL
jgi:hypothetical protein